MPGAYEALELYYAAAIAKSTSHAVPKRQKSQWLEWT